MPDASSRLFTLGSRGAGFLVRFVFPATCAGCGAAGTWVCDLCAMDLVDIGDQRIAGSSRAFSVDDSLHGGSTAIEMLARYAYAGPARRAVHLLKYKGERARAEWFADEMAQLVRGRAKEDALLVPVPLTARRERRRGYNQSSEIAQRLSDILDIPTERGVARVRETRPQVELTGVERLHNVRGAFAGLPSLRDRHVVLVDDVITTGATMQECGRACYAAGATTVIGMACAAGVGRDSEEDTNVQKRR